MRFRLLIAALLLVAVSSPAFAQAAPLDRAEILGRLAQGYDPSYLAEVVKTRGISFSPTVDFLEGVKLAGGDGILVERLSRSSPTAGPNVSQLVRPSDSLAKCAEWIHVGAATLAEKDCRAAIDENPESPWPIMAALRALAVSGTRSAEETVALLRRAVTLDPTLVGARRALAVSDIAPDERAKEMEAVVALTQAQPAEDGAFTNDISVGGIPEAGNFTPETRAAVLARIQSSLQEHPDIATARLSGVFAYASLGDLGNATREIGEALRLEPGNADLHVALASFYLSQRDTESELAQYREAVRIAPYDNANRRRLVEALLREKRPEEAVREWRDFLALSPLDLAGSSSLVNLYLEQQERSSAIAELRRSLKASFAASASEGDFVEVRQRDLDRLARLLSENHEFDAAREQYALLLRFKPDDAALHNHLGNVFYAQHRCAEASGEYGEALRLQPTLPDTHQNLANCLLVTQKTDEAIAEYRQAIELDSDGTEPRAKLGVALLAKGELNSAIEQFQLALADDPENTSVLVNLGHAYDLNNDCSSAIETLRRALSLNPDLPAAETELARINAAAQCGQLATSVKP